MPEAANTPIMMLSSTDLGADVARCKELGISIYLMKPVRQPELLKSAIAALSMQPAAAKRPDRSPAVCAGRSMQILIAEDNLVNQRVAATLLEKRGHSVTLAVTGREALEAWERRPFDIILMDVQMPEMDGFEATRAIREAETATGDHISIVAMTAHAMKGDRERCLAAGMDGYIPKPLEPKLLFEFVDQFGAEASSRRKAPEALAVPR